MTAVLNKTKKETSQKLIEFFFFSCKVGFPLIGFSVLLALVVPLYVSPLAGKVLTAKLTFASLGLLFGILQVFLGVLLSLVGVTIDYDVDAGLGPAKIKLASASPGILLVIIGNLLFAFSLVREFEVSETTGQFVGAVSEPSAAVNGILNEGDPLKDASGPE